MINEYSDDWKAIKAYVVERIALCKEELAAGNITHPQGFDEHRRVRIDELNMLISKFTTGESNV